mgnify:CR=1 FL=1
MILISPEIIAALKAHTFTLNKVSVKAAYAGKAPTCPMLALDELPSNDGAYIDGLPRVVRNVLTLEAYCKADAFLNEQFGLTMIGQIQAAPYSDTTIFRAVANYYVYIDTRTNEIYRSINKEV